MGRGSNGNAGSGRPANSTGGKEKYEPPTATIKTDRSGIRATEAGMSPETAKIILAAELKVKDKNHETLQVFDEDGNLVAKNMRGGKHSVSIPWEAHRSNLILTHNHPQQTSGTAFAAVGQSFSGADIKNLVRLNHKEVRAVTNGYIYSMRRPKGGFRAGINPFEIERFMDREWDRRVGEAGNEYRKIVWSGDSTPEKRRLARQRYHRNMIAINHQIAKEAAERYGLIYTRRKI